MKKKITCLILCLATFAISSRAQHSDNSKKNNPMLTYQQALKLATEKLMEIAINHPEYFIWEEKTMTKDYGWIFFPTTQSYIKTGNIMSLSPGVSPILVNKNDSSCIMAPSSVPFQTFIKDYEQQLK